MKKNILEEKFLDQCSTETIIGFQLCSKNIFVWFFYHFTPLHVLFGRVCAKFLVFASYCLNNSAIKVRASDLKKYPEE